MKIKHITPEIWVVEDFMSESQCNKMIKQAEDECFTQAAVQIDGKQQIFKGVRNNDRVQLCTHELANDLFDIAKPFLKQTVIQYEEDKDIHYDLVGLNEMLRFYRYIPPQRFKMHPDGSFKRNENERSLYTFLVYLNDGFIGGETNFRDHGPVIPKAGSLLIFKHELWHEGKPLIQGTKYVLRSDVMYKKV